MTSNVQGDDHQDAAQSTAATDPEDRDSTGTKPPARTRAAEAESAWRQSPERSAAQRRLMFPTIILIGGGLIVDTTYSYLLNVRTTQFVLSHPLDQFGLRFEEIRWENIRLILISIFLVVATLLYAYGTVSFSEKRREFENRFLLDSTRGNDHSPSSEFDFQTLWRNNREQLEIYHRIVLNFAASPRQYTQISLLIGFAFIVVISLIAMITATATAAAISSSVVASAGAIVTGFIAQTTLKNSAASSRELVEFFSHPIEEQRALAAERIIETMPTDKQVDAKMLVLEYMMNSTARRKARRGKESEK